MPVACGGAALRRRRSFVRFVTRYGSHHVLLRQVSDLFYELGYHRWLTKGLLEREGRLTRFGPVNDPYLEFVWRSGIPLTVRDVTRLTTRVMSALSRSFRVRPGQHRARAQSASPDVVRAEILAEFEHKRDIELHAALPVALARLIEDATFASLLYTRFRSGAVHELDVRLDERRFFAENTPYWRSLRSGYYGGFLQLEFSAPFLIEMLRSAIKQYRAERKHTGKLPFAILFSAFPETVFEHLDLLDNAPEEATTALALKFSS